MNDPRNTPSSPSTPSPSPSLDGDCCPRLCGPCGGTGTNLDDCNDDGSCSWCNGSGTQTRDDDGDWMPSRP